MQGTNPSLAKPTNVSSSGSIIVSHLTALIVSLCQKQILVFTASIQTTFTNPLSVTVKLWQKPIVGQTSVWPTRKTHESCVVAWSSISEPLRMTIRLSWLLAVSPKTASHVCGIHGVACSCYHLNLNLFSFLFQLESISTRILWEK